MPYDKETGDALQAYCEMHDFTGNITAFDDKRYTPAQLQMYVKAKKFFAQLWLKLLPETQFGAAWSLDAVTASNMDAVENAADFFSPAESTEEAYMELRNGFLATLPEDDRAIFIMRENGKTQKEIAGALGYKTRSAVTNRLQAMREPVEMYIKNKGKIPTNRNLKRWLRGKTESTQTPKQSIRLQGMIKKYR